MSDHLRIRSIRAKIRFASLENSVNLMSSESPTTLPPCLRKKAFECNATTCTVNAAEETFTRLDVYVYAAMPLTSSCMCGNAAAKFMYMRQCRWNSFTFSHPIFGSFAPIALKIMLLIQLPFEAQRASNALICSLCSLSCLVACATLSELHPIR